MTRKNWLMTAATAFNTLILSAMVHAQQSAPSADIDINTGGGGGGWASQWYIWAALVAVFLVVVIAITNRGSSRHS